MCSTWKWSKDKIEVTLSYIEPRHATFIWKNQFQIKLNYKQGFRKFAVTFIELSCGSFSVFWFCWSVVWCLDFKNSGIWNTVFLLDKTIHGRENVGIGECKIVKTLHFLFRPFFFVLSFFFAYPYIFKCRLRRFLPT